MIETVDFCHRFCFVNKITEPTRVTDRTKTILDVILVSHAERYITSGNLQLGLSDHDLVFVVTKNKLSRPKATLYWISQHEELWQLGILDRVKKRPLGHGVLIPRCWRYLGSLERSLYKPTAAAWRILVITRMFVGLRQDRCWNIHSPLNQ